MSRRAAAALLVAVGLAVSLAVAVVAAPWARDSPDGLERVAFDEGLEASAAEHVTADSPAADYSTWAWRGAGVVLVFVLAAGFTAASSGWRPGAVRTSAPADAAASPPG